MLAPSLLFRSRVLCCICVAVALADACAERDAPIAEGDEDLRIRVTDDAASRRSGAITNAALEQVRTTDRALRWRFQKVDGWLPAGLSADMLSGAVAAADGSGQLAILLKSELVLYRIDITSGQTQTVDAKNGLDVSRPDTIVYFPPNTIYILDKGVSATGRRGLVPVAFERDPSREHVERSDPDYMGSGVMAFWSGSIVFDRIVRDSQSAPTHELVVRHPQGASAVLARRQFEEEDTYAYEHCPGLHLGRRRPLGSRGVAWYASQDKLLVQDSDDYIIDIYSSDGERTRIQRNIPPIMLNAAIAKNVARTHYGPDGFSIVYPTGRCEVTPDQAIAAVGFLPSISPVDRFIADPLGRVWVRRYTSTGTAAVDVFDSDGTYIGTLPPRSPFPVAFVNPEQFVMFDVTRNGKQFGMYKITKPRS